MRVGLITTHDTNIGDDFIREGVLRVLYLALRDQPVQLISVNKHAPFTVYPAWHPLRWLPRGRRRASRILAPLGMTRFDQCDAIVQCGAPVVWSNCHASEWAEPLWRQVVGRLHHRVRVLNLAAGSCYSWRNPPASITDPNDAAFIADITRFARLTTARDELAAKLLGARMLCCTAFLAAPPELSPAPTASGSILINYMTGGGHFDWDQALDPRIWETTMRELIARLRTRHPLKFIAHTPAEADVMRKLDPSIPVLCPATPDEYFRQAAGAQAAICNRLHASVGLAGMGIPSVAVGTDTRLLMVKAVGLPALFVADASTQRVEHELENLLANRAAERDRLLALREQTLRSYVDAVAGALS